MAVSVTFPAVCDTLFRSFLYLGIRLVRVPYSHFASYHLPLSVCYIKLCKFWRRQSGMYTTDDSVISQVAAARLSFYSCGRQTHDGLCRLCIQPPLVTLRIPLFWLFPSIFPHDDKCRPGSYLSEPRSDGYQGFSPVASNVL